MALDPLVVLRTVPLFRQVPERDLLALAGLVRERRQPRGSMILTQGDEGETLFLIPLACVRKHLLLREFAHGLTKELVVFGERKVHTNGVLGAVRPGVNAR